LRSTFRHPAGARETPPIKERGEARAGRPWPAALRATPEALNAGEFLVDPGAKSGEGK